MNDAELRDELLRALEQIPRPDPTPEQYATRRRHHDRLVAAGIVDEADLDPERLRTWLGPDPQEPPC